MDLLEKIINCKTDEEADNLITEAIKNADKNSTKVEQLGFLNYGKTNHFFKGFIPLKTRIKYENLAIETYSMETTDFFYDFAHFIRKYNISTKGGLIHFLEIFINSYFGYPGASTRENVFFENAYKTTTTDEELFAALDSNKLGDLKGKGAAECTERGAMAQQILSLFGTETYYCMGCVDLGDKQEGHCFNIVKRKNDYALLDYSIPITSHNKNGDFKAYFPFIGILSNEEFEDFINNGTLKSFTNYEYINGNQRVPLETKRSYIIGSFEITKDNTDSIKK